MALIGSVTAMLIVSFIITLYMIPITNALV